MEEQTNTIIIETQGNVGIITLNRPDVSNAVNLEMLNDIAYQVQTWEYDEQIKVIIIKGNDNVFAAGIDVQELNNEVSQQSFALKTWQDEFAKIANCAKPMIAAVSGYSLGIGCDLALSADIVLATDSAQFGYPETSIGMIPAFGGCSRLVHTIGKAKTMETILTGKAISAQEAELSGLISRIVPLADIESEAMRIANRIASLPFQAIVQAKETIKQTENMSLRNGMELESKSCRLSLNTIEFKENLSSLSQKM